MIHCDFEPAPGGKVTWRCCHCPAASTRDDHPTAAAEARRHLKREHRGLLVGAPVVAPVNGNGAKP